MDPITLLVIAAIGMAAGAVGVVTWQTIRNWLNTTRVYGGTARIINNRLQSGNYRVVAGVFDARGTLKTQKAWEARSLDTELAHEFEQGGGVIVVHL